MNRHNILTALETIITNSGYFKKVYTAQTGINKEHSFPICWILLGSESIGRVGSTLNQQGRIITGYIRIGVKQDRGTDVLNPLIDNVYDLLDANNTINDTALKCEITNIVTSEGLIYPHEIAELNLAILIR